MSEQPRHRRLSRPTSATTGNDQAGGQLVVDIATAARQLGLSENAVRKRIQRGTLTARSYGGRVYVVLTADQAAAKPADQRGLAADQWNRRNPDASAESATNAAAKPQDTGDLASDQPTDQRSGQIPRTGAENAAKSADQANQSAAERDRLLDEVAFLRAQLEASREAERELRVLLAQAIQLPQLASGTAPSPSPDAPQNAQEAPEAPIGPTEDVGAVTYERDRQRPAKAPRWRIARSVASRVIFILFVTALSVMIYGLIFPPPDSAPVFTWENLERFAAVATIYTILTSVWSSRWLARWIASYARSHRDGTEQGEQ